MSETSREAYLQLAVDYFRASFEEKGYEIPEKVHVSVGYSKRSRGAQIGWCYTAKSSKDEANQIFLSPEIHEPVQVLSTLLHELVHAADDCQSGHTGNFRKMAVSLGLTGKMTATVPGDDLVAELRGLSDVLGPYPHAKLMPFSMGKKQTTRMLKVQCPACDFHCRATRKQLDNAGPPTCGCGQKMEEV